MADLHRQTAGQILARIRSREISAAEVISASLERIRRIDPHTGAFRCVLEEESLTSARAVDDALSRGEDPGPLAGLPVAIKDVICLRGHPTTCGSRILENFMAPYDATVVEHLRRAGAVIVGKTNMDEFAMGSSTENSAYEKTRNPWDPDRVPGGSSGGSAAAVAAEMVPVSLGTDTGGSIRQPAAFCGVAGLKTSYGRVSRFGLVAFASSLDQIGPFARSVADLGLVLSVIAGHDPRDSTSATVEVPKLASASGAGGKPLRIGIPKEYFPAALDPEIAGAVGAALKQAESQGARVEEISLPHTDYAIPTYYIIATAEASSNLARYDGARYGFRSREAADLTSMYRLSRSAGFGKEVKRRIMLGTYVLSSGYYDAYYLKAQKVRTLLRDDFEKAFEKVDLIATPTTPSTAFRFGEKTDDPLQMYLSDIFTATINLAGLPALSMPCGLSRQGLPIGLQLIGPAFGEERLLKAGAALESELGFRDRHRPAALDA